MDHSLNVTMVIQLLRSDDVTVTLQWPREPGAVYHVSVSPGVSHTERTPMGHVLAMNLTISYDIQYNVSITSSLCGVTTTKTLKYGKLLVSIIHTWQCLYGIPNTINLSIKNRCNTRLSIDNNHPFESSWFWI